MKQTMKGNLNGTLDYETFKSLRCITAKSVDRVVFSLEQESSIAFLVI